MEIVQDQWIDHPLMTSAHGEVFGHFVGAKTGDEPAELMTAMFEAIEEWWEIQFFKNVCDGLEGSNRKGLILVWRYVVWCLQCCLHFCDPKIQIAEDT